MSKNQPNRWKKEEIVQAVVIADSFHANFAPFSKTVPPCLLPIANRPFLDYTLQCLSAGGVNEVILFCSAFPDQIRQFVSKREWSDIAISVVVSEGCRSVGDAMRDLDTKALIRSDFILVSGFVIGNVNLEALLKKHGEFRKLDQSGQTIAMTCLYKDGGRRRTNPDNEVTFAMDSSTNRILWHSKPSRTSKVRIPMEIILGQDRVDVCHGLLDTRVYICSSSVPPLFSDNFDFQTMDDFIKGLLMNEEIIASTLYCHILPSENYAATVSSWADYQSVTNDVIHRWVFPLVPDACYKYTFHKRSVYLGKNITLSVGCTLEQNVVVGDGCVIGENTCIEGSVLGKNCVIGNNVILTGCYLFDGVNVESDCNVSYSVLGDKCKIEKGATLSQGCILGTSVVIEAGKNISALRLQSTPSLGDDEGKIGPHAYTCFMDSDDSEAESDEENDKKPFGGHGLIFQKPNWTEGVEEVESSDSEAESADEEAPEELDDTSIFYNEVLDSLIRGYTEKLPCDNLILEINSSRYAYNVTLRELNCLVVKAVLNLQSEEETTTTAYWEELKKRINFFDPVLKKYIRSTESQKDCLASVEEVAEENASLQEVIMQLLHLLYNKDILYSDSIEWWYENPSDGALAKEIRIKVKRFIVWLREAVSESGSEEASDSD